MATSGLRIVLLTSLFLSSAMFADTLRFDPPNATPQHAVDATVSGIWHDLCLPSVGNVVVAGSTITLHLIDPDVICNQAVAPYSQTFHLGFVSSGIYTVIALADQGVTSRELTRSTLVVTDGGAIRFDPPGPSAHHSVDAVISGAWSSTCGLFVKSVAADGSTITVHLRADAPVDGACGGAITSFSLTAHLDLLPPGNYTVIAMADVNGSGSELVRAPLIVRDADTLNILPYGVPVTGGQILIANPFNPAAATVMIDGVAAPGGSVVEGILLANAGPHAPGAVDVTVKNMDSAAVVESKSALIYYDPDSVDPAVFEPVLFPLSFQGPGAFGSQWTTESFIAADATGPPAYFLKPLPCSGCSSELSLETKQLTNDSNPWGHVLYLMRGTASAIAFASRIRDTSREAQSGGTAVPVVRESDFRSHLKFLNLPHDVQYRATLRLWSLGDYPEFEVNFNTGFTSVRSMTRIPDTAMWFGSVDVTSLMSSTAGNPPFMVVAPRLALPAPAIWGMLSITNNNTQQVTIIPPQ